MTTRKEEGAIPPKKAARISIALVYPNSYRVGMANLGFQHIYKYLNSIPDLSCERFFVDWPDSEQWKKGKLTSEETRAGLSEFSIIAFSLPFESDYPNIPKALICSSIPVFQKDRGPYDPLVIAGGISVSMNPEPVADFLDIVFIGEILEYIGQRAVQGQGFFQHLKESLIDSGLSNRERIYGRMKDFTGVYIPSAYSVEYDKQGLVKEINVKEGFPKIIKAVKGISKETTVPVSNVFSEEAEFGTSLLVETNRGCSRGCRFCAAGWIHFPVRYRKFESFLGDVNTAIEKNRTVGIVGSDLAGHPQLEEILDHIIEKGGRFSLSSIRPEGLTQRIIELMARSGQKTATLAPEVASERLKKLIGKNIPSERFIELINKLVNEGIPNVRLYFMMGLPTETDQDFRDIIDFILECKEAFLEASKPIGRIGTLSVQINPFTPKPWTPFQWSRMENQTTLNKRAKIARKRLLKEPNIKLRIESIKEAAIQALLSRGDRRLSRVILKVISGEKWPQALKTEGLTMDFYVTRDRSFEEKLPWDIVYHGINKDRLWRASPTG